MEGGRGGEVKGDRKGGEWERGFFFGGGGALIAPKPC